MKYVLVFVLCFCVLYAQEATQETQNIVVTIEPATDFVKGKVLLQATATADSVEFLCDGNKIGDGIANNDKWQCEWDSTQLQDGSHELTVIATTGEQKATSDTLSCKVDNTAPQVIANAEQTSPTEAQLTLNIEDQYDCSTTIAVNGQIQENYSGSGNFTWPVTPGSSYTIDVEVVDLAQNVTQKQITFTCTSAELSLEIIRAFPTMSNDQVSCQIKTNAANVVCYLSENPDAQAEIEKNGDVVDITWSPEDDGLFTLVLFLESEDGKNKEQLFPIRIDTTPPSITLTENESITSNSSVAISAIVEDASQIEEVLLLQEERQIASLEKTNDSWQWKGELTAEGVHSFQVVSKDILGNMGKSKVQKFIFDRTPPTINNIQITPQKLQIGIVNVTISYADSVSGISQGVTPKIFLGDGERSFEIVKYDENSCSAELLITEDFSVGEYSVYMENLQDLAGNVTSKTSLGTINITEKSQSTGNWPLLPQNKIPQVSLNTTNDELSISGKAQDAVVSVEDGVIVAILSSKDKPGYIIIENLRGKKAWGYYDVLAAKHPSEKRHWALGDAVGKGDTIAQLTSDCPLRLQLLVEKDGNWVKSEEITTALQPQAAEYAKTVPVATATTNINFPEKLQTSDWLLIAYLAVFLIIAFALITPKKVKA